MAAKLLHSLADDNPDLQKQIGCMTGIFQLFDRQQMLAARRITAHNPKKLLPPGGSHMNSSSQKELTDGPSRFSSVENQISKNVQEKQRISTESSRVSFSSSSRSSSFSSQDCNKAPQLETVSYDRIIFPDTPSREPALTLPNESPQFSQPNLDLRDVVKDSIYKDGQGLSKTATKEGVVNSLHRARKSPRPELSNTDDRSYGLGSGGKQESSADLNESLRVLAKLRDANWHLSEPRELTRSSSYHAKEGPSFIVPKDAPRFSYDGRETNHLSFESRDSLRSSSKHRELPRLSLDSREGSMRNFNPDSKSSSNLKNLQKECSSSINQSSLTQQAAGIQVRPPSVVAKLMGLEMLPDSEDNAGLRRTSPVEDAPPLTRSSEASDLCRTIRTSISSKNLWREPNSPRWKNSDSAMKPISRFPIEPAPWKQSDSTRNTQKPASRNVKAPAKKTSPFPSVYCEIEKRLKDLKFSQSGKDLRALKQILEAMQEKGLLESQDEDQDLNYITKRDTERKHTSSAQNARLANDRNHPQDGQVTTLTRKVPSLSPNFESPIVIMKPAKLVERSGIPSSSVIPLDSFPGLPKLHGGDLTDSRKVRVNSRTPKDQIPNIIHGGDSSVNPNDMKNTKKTSKPAHTSLRSQQLPKESNIASLKGSGSISPRMQHKKPELEKQSRPPTPPSDSSRSRRQSSRQQAESNSPGGRRRPKHSNPQLGSDRLGEIRCESRDLSSRDSGNSAELDENAVLDSKVDTGLTCSERSLETSSDKPLNRNAGQNPVSNFAEKKSILILSENESMAEATTEIPEYPSPISVLDSAMYNDDSPSPLKQLVKTLKGDEPCGLDRFSSTVQLSSSEEVAPRNVGSGPTSEINRKKLQNIENLVQKLRRLNSSHDEARTDYIASLCENTNPDHRYISEVLLASGLLLRDLGSSLTAFQFHSSGHPINPELFLVLEQTKASSLTKECSPEEALKEKFHRKLIFDAVNEILAQKLISVGPSAEPWLRPHKLARKMLNAQKLLRELCSEIDQLQTKRQEYNLEDEDDELKNILWDDVMNLSESWIDYRNELSGMVLDVERSIFKDLVDEVVIGESSGLRIKPVKRRQLFRK